MATESAIIEHMHGDLEFLKEKIISLEEDIKMIIHSHPEIKEEYLERLRAIEAQPGRRFSSQEEFFHFLDHEL